MFRMSLALVMTLTIAACSSGEEKEKNTLTPCTNGNTKCSGNLIQTCLNQTWNTGNDCGSTATCTASSATAASCVTNGPNTSGWSCEASYFDADDGCDCGCTVADPDCNGGGCTTPGQCADAACEFCYDANGDGIACITYPGVCTSGTEGYTCVGDVSASCDGTSTEGEPFADCADITGDGSQSGTCHTYSDATVPNCVFSEGDGCYFSDGQSYEFIFACGSGGTPSGSMICDIFEGCTAGAGTCTPPASGATFANVCEGNHLIMGCVDYTEVAVKLSLNCASADNGSGTCIAADNICEHSTAGGYCDNELVRCGSGMTCNMTDYVCGT